MLNSESDCDQRSTLADDLFRHPDLVPLIGMDSRGLVECFGWVGPVRVWLSEASYSNGCPILDGDD
jgi:hypothetical protein